MLQTALDLLERGYDVHVLADGVSSCNKEEIPWALARMRQAGVQITTSESAAFQIMGKIFRHRLSERPYVFFSLADSAEPNFKTFAGLIKQESETTKSAIAALLGPTNSVD